MLVSAIISEYNPFHNGHLLHIKRTREITLCDFVVVILSGSVVQRGEVCSISKWDRAKMAILAGADLVLELPAPFSCSSAENFARGAVSIINKLSFVDFLSFGSECGNVDILRTVAKCVSNDGLSNSILKYLKTNISYAKAREMAICDHLSPQYSEIVRGSNNILGIEYIKAILESGSNLIPVSVLRENVFHNDENICGNVASASAIRKMMLSGEDYSLLVPSFTSDIIKYANIANMQNIDRAIMLHLRGVTNSDLSSNPDISEGLGFRLVNAVAKSCCYDEVISNTTSRRYPSSRIRRAIMSSLLSITKDDLAYDLDFARVLAFNDNGKKLIRLSAIPIVTKPSSFANILNSRQQRIFEIEGKATDLWGLSCNSPLLPSVNLKTSPI